MNQVLFANTLSFRGAYTLIIVLLYVNLTAHSTLASVSASEKYCSVDKISLSYSYD